MFRYFNDVKTEEDVKSRFKNLAKKLHPDCGGNAEEFKKMMSEYQIAFDRYKNIHVNAAGDTYEKETNETAAGYAEMIEKLLKMEGVTIEIIGSWIWLTGNTMTYREELKKMHFFWSKTKKAWYHNGNEKKSRRRGHYKMDDLRMKWGSEIVGTGKDETEKLTA